MRVSQTAWQTKLSSSNTLPLFNIGQYHFNSCDTHVRTVNDHYSHEDLIFILEDLIIVSRAQIPHCMNCHCHCLHHVMGVFMT